MYHNIFMVSPGTEQSQQSSYIVGFAPPPNGVPCIVLFKKHFQYIMLTKIKNQALQISLGRRRDPLPLNQNGKDKQAIIKERIAHLKRNKIVKQTVPQNELPEDRISPSNFTQSGTIPVQNETASSVKTENGNSSEAFFASFDSNKIASARDSIDVKNIDNENNT